jgi:hypothetical protein
MASVHEIGIAADTRGFDDGIRSGIIKPLGDAEDAFKDLERAASDTGRDGARDVSRIEDALEDARKESERLEQSTKDLGESGRQSLGKVRDGASEVQTEFGSNLGEAVSSFRGDLSDLGQIGQDTLGGLAATVSGMGPAGLLGAFALAAGAAGLGAVTAGIQEAEEKQKALNEAAAQWAEAYTDSAGRIVSAAHVVAEVNAIATDSERYKEAGENAKNWGVDVQTAMLTMAGDATALAITQESLTAKQQEFARSTEDVVSQGEGYAASAGTLSEKQRALRDEIVKGNEALGIQTEAMTLGQQQAREAAGALFDYASRVGEATDQVDDLGNKIVKLPDGKEIVVDAKTQTAYEDLDAIEKRELAEKTVRVRAVIDTSAWDRWTPAQKRGLVEGKLGRTWE